MCQSSSSGVWFLSLPLFKRLKNHHYVLFTVTVSVLRLSAWVGAIPQTYICICIYTCIDNIYISFISLSPFIVCMGGYVVVCHTKGGPYGHDVTSSNIWEDAIRRTYTHSSLKCIKTMLVSRGDHMVVK